MRGLFLASVMAVFAASPALADGYTGVWNSHWEAAGGAKAGSTRVIVTQSPFDKSEYDGMYDNPGYNALLTGHLKGASWSGAWMQPGGSSGTFAFKFSADGRSWTGTWTFNGETAAWNGSKIGNLP